jgi:hypothetical protein
VTHKIAKHIILAVGAVAFTAASAFATTACDSGSVTVTAPPAYTNPPTPALVCTLGGLTFSWEQLKFTPSAPPSTLDITTPFTGIVGNDYDLNFSFVNGPPPPVDILMTYEVSSTGANISAVDSSFSSADTLPPASITETICGTDPGLSGGTCTDVLTVLANTGGSALSGNFGPVQNIWIIKDIGTGGPIAISTFTDSVVATPEPSSIGLMLIAAFGIAASARKLRKA